MNRTCTIRPARHAWPDRRAPRAAAVALAAWAALGLGGAQAADADGDGMDDAYEVFFGLCPTNPADAAADYDADGLGNLAESALWTDPFTADTDRDGFGDGSDSRPVSRAWCGWGDPFFSASNAYIYTWPPWTVAAGCDGGVWVTNPTTAWRVPAEAPEDTGALLVIFDRAAVTNDLRLGLGFGALSNATLFVDLYDTNGLPVVSNPFGNVCGVSDSATNFALPLSAHPEAAVLRLRRGTGEVTVRWSQHYADADGDGLDSEQEQQLGTSDQNPDSDGDGLGDYAEVFVHGTDPAAWDTDGDTLSDGAELQTYGTDPLRADTDADGLPDGWELQRGFDPAAIHASDIVGWWRLDEPVGPVAYDSAPATNHGTIQGAVHIAGLRDGALAFDGVGAAVGVPPSAAYRPGVFTLGVCARFDRLFGNATAGGAADGVMVLVGQPNAAGGPGLELRKTERHSLVLEMVNSAAGATGRVETAAGFAVTGRWYRLLATYDGTNLALYADGEAIGAAACGAGPEFDPGSGLAMASSGREQDGRLWGALDELFVLDRALDAVRAVSVGESLADPDHDGLVNLGEYRSGTDPFAADGDGDGLSDGEEVAFYGTDPNCADTDGDGLSDFAEVLFHGTDPLRFDTDFDGLSDAWEVAWGYDPFSIAADALGGWWRLDELAGGNALDSSPHLNHGVAQGTTGATGMVFSARRFDGVDDGIGIYNADAYKPLPGLSVMSYVNFGALYGNATAGSAPDGSMVLLAQRNAGSGWGYALAKTERQSLVFSLSNAVSGAAVAAETADGFTTTCGWYHVAGVYDGSNALLLVNGRTAAVAYCEGAVDYAPTNGLTLGFGGLAAEGRLAGALDEVRVYNRALAAEELAALEFGARDVDSDGDGLSNFEEYRQGTDALRADSDGDGLSDAEELTVTHTDPRQADTDGDGIPDGWEQANGLDPLSAADASADPDGDGRTNLQEYQARTDPQDADTDGDGLSDGAEVATHGTNPLLADSDGDGMPDQWEVANALNPLLDDAREDPDSDWLLNVEECRADTDPNAADTDGDGVGDYEEVRLAHSDPRTADFDGTVDTVCSRNGSQTSAVWGAWSAWGAELYSRSRRGYAEYSLTAPAAGTYRIEVEGYGTYLEYAKLLACVDGGYVGKSVLVCPVGSVTNTARFYTPALAAGDHTVRLVWDNAWDAPRLHLTRVRLQTAGGTWAQNRLQRTCGVDAAVAESKVSPYCLEGTGYFPEAMAIAGGAAVKPAPANRWYAEIPLPEQGDTNLVVSFQGGAVTLTSTVAWAAFNVLSDPGLTVRVGDALRLTALPAGATGGTVRLEVAGSTGYVTQADAPVIHVFDSPGDFAVTAVHSNGAGVTAGAVTIRVTAAAFPTNRPAVWWGRTRTLSCPGLQHADVSLVGDEDTTFSNVGAIWNGSLQFDLKLDDVDGPRYLAARLGPGGPIAASTALDPFWLRGTVDGVLYVVDTLSDGTRVVQNRLSMRDLPASVTVQLGIFAGGVTFDDGTIVRNLTAADFSESGDYVYYLVVPPGGAITCHNTGAYQGTAPLSK